MEREIKQEIKESQLGQLRLIGDLLDKLNEATELLQEAQSANFNSNLGARIKMFLQKLDSEPVTNNKI